MGLLSRIETFINGQDLVEGVENKLRIACEQPLQRNLVRPISLLITDLQMPVMNGIQALKEIKKLYAYARVKYPLLNVLEPEYVVLSSFSGALLRKHLGQDNIYGFVWKSLQTLPQWTIYASSF